MSVVAVPGAARPVDARARGRRLPVISLGIIATFVVVAILAPLISPADPYEQSLRLRHRPPVWEERGSWAYPLGTDRLGRDLLSRIIHGARVSLAAGVLTVLVASVLGAAIGLVGGCFGGRAGARLMRSTGARRSRTVIPRALYLGVQVG